MRIDWEYYYYTLVLLVVEDSGTLALSRDNKAAFFSSLPLVFSILVAWSLFLPQHSRAQNKKEWPVCIYYDSYLDSFCRPLNHLSFANFPPWEGRSLSIVPAKTRITMAAAVYPCSYKVIPAPSLSLFACGTNNLDEKQHLYLL